MLRHALWMFLLGGLALAGCDRGPARKKAATTGPKTDFTIAVIPKGTSHVFWQSVHAGAERAAAELKIARPLWQGPAQERDVGRQIAIVDDMLVRGVDAVVLAPIDESSLVNTVLKVHKKMPIVIFDSGVRTDQYTSFVATDNYLGGKLAGQHLLKLLGEEGGEVCVVRVMAGSASTMAREKGFEDAIKANPKVILRDAGYGESDRGISQTKAADALVAYPNLKAFFGPNESSTYGILNALEERKLAGRLRFVGFDSSRELAQGLDDRKIDALVLQNPVKMGYESVKAACAALRGQKVEKDVKIEPTLITQENKDQPAMQELLRPKL